MKLEDIYKAKAKENLSTHTKQGYLKSDNPLLTQKKVRRILQTLLTFRHHVQRFGPVT